MTLTHEGFYRPATLLMPPIACVLAVRSMSQHDVVGLLRESLSNHMSNGSWIQWGLRCAIVKIGHRTFGPEILQYCLETTRLLRIPHPTEGEDEPLPIRSLKDKPAAPHGLIAWVRNYHDRNSWRCAWGATPGDLVNHGVPPLRRSTNASVPRCGAHLTGQTIDELSTALPFVHLPTRQTAVEACQRVRVVGG